MSTSSTSSNSKPRAKVYRDSEICNSALLKSGLMPKLFITRPPLEWQYQYYTPVKPYQNFPNNPIQSLNFYTK